MIFSIKRPVLIRKYDYFILTDQDHYGIIYISRLMTKPTKWPERRAKIQISLGIRPVFAVSSIGSQGPKLSLCEQQRLWSDWADAQADLSLCWAHRAFCWFCHEAAHVLIVNACAYIIMYLMSRKFQSDIFSGIWFVHKFRRDIPGSVILEECHQDWWGVNSKIAHR